MRLFIGVPVAPAVAEQLAELRVRLERPGDGLRWSSPESWHITLQFLGSTTDLQYACVLQRLENIAAPGFPLQLEGLGFFDRAGVFFVDVLVTEPLNRLQQIVTRATSHCGFVPEDRPYHPHITLARRKGQSRDGLRELKRRFESTRKSIPRLPAFSACEFLLYESFTSPAGSRYEVRERFPLGTS